MHIFKKSVIYGAFLATLAISLSKWKTQASELFTCIICITLYPDIKMQKVIKVLPSSLY